MQCQPRITVVRRPLEEEESFEDRNLRRSIAPQSKKAAADAVAAPARPLEHYDNSPLSQKNRRHSSNTRGCSEYERRASGSRSSKLLLTTSAAPSILLMPARRIGSSEKSHTKHSRRRARSLPRSLSDLQADSFPPLAPLPSSLSLHPTAHGYGYSHPTMQRSSSASSATTPVLSSRSNSASSLHSMPGPSSRARSTALVNPVYSPQSAAISSPSSVISGSSIGTAPPAARRRISASAAVRTRTAAPLQPMRVSQWPDDARYNPDTTTGPTGSLIMRGGAAVPVLALNRASAPASPSSAPSSARRSLPASGLLTPPFPFSPISIYDSPFSSTNSSPASSTAWPSDVAQQPDEPAVVPAAPPRVSAIGSSPGHGSAIALMAAPSSSAPASNWALWGQNSWSSWAEQHNSNAAVGSRAVIKPPAAAGGQVPGLL